MAVANSGPSHTNATTAGAGTGITFVAVCAHHAAHVVVTGFAGSGGALIALEGSMDGTSWVTLPDGGMLHVTGNGVYRMAHAIPQPVLFLRTNIKSIDPGVSAITVNTILASV